MKISISAAQGQGKTTFISDIEKYSKHSKHFTLFPRKSARTIIEQLGITLEQIYEDKNALMEFQAAVFKQHSTISEFKYFTKFLLIERSFIDISTFTTINLGRFNSLSDWISMFHNACDVKQNTIDIIVYIKKMLDSKDDGVRPYNTHYNTAYDCYLYDQIKNRKHINIDVVDRLERVKKFDTELERMQLV